MSDSPPIQSDDWDSVRAACLAFPKQFKTLLLATTDADGKPNASYAPYLNIGGWFYIYISGLAQHTQNIQVSKRASILFIENEEMAEHPFVRKRLTFDCSVTEIYRPSPQFSETLDRFQDMFGHLMKTLRNLADFHLFCLSPEEANFVLGFGQAYRFSGEELTLITHRNQKGHTPLKRDVK